MFLYHLKIAWRAVLKTPALSLICVLGIGLGVGVSGSMTSLHHLFSQNPLPKKADLLFNIRLDTFDPNREFFDVEPGEPPKAQTYRDMAALMDLGGAVRQTGVGSVRANIFPEGDLVKPYQSTLQLVHSDFFPMFQAPFRYGQAWNKEADKKREALIVLSHDANIKIFGGIDSVGKTIRVGDRPFAVVGVLDQFRPTPKMYDMVNDAAGKTREFFIPFDHVREDYILTITGNTDGWGARETFDGDKLFTTAEYYWIQHWVELEPGGQAEYLALLADYSREQKAMGRYPRPINNRATPMMDWVTERNRLSRVTKPTMVISFLFLIVCAVNLTGLLLSKFLSRASVIGVHRALGASRMSVFMQHLLEVEILGIAGGVLGFGLAALALKLLAGLIPANFGFIDPQLLQPNQSTIMFSLGFSMVAGMIAGIYPAWRACRVAPAIQLKV